MQTHTVSGQLVKIFLITVQLITLSLYSQTTTSCWASGSAEHTVEAVVYYKALLIRTGKAKKTWPILIFATLESSGSQ